MELFKNNILAAAAFFGVSGGVLALINVIISKFIFVSMFPVLTDVPTIMSILLIITSGIAAIHYFKKVLNGGYLHFWQGLIISFCVWAIFMLVYSTGIYAFLTLFPAYLTAQTDALVNAMMASKSTYIEIYKSEAYFNSTIHVLKATTPVNVVISSFDKISPIMAFVMFVVSIIMRKQRRDANGKLL